MHATTQPVKLSLDRYRLLLLALMALYVLVFAGQAFAQHTGMRTHKSDLGQMDQALWNTSRGRFVESVRGDELSTRMTDHVEPIFALIAPVLWLWDDVRALLLVQVVAVALGAWPLYALARRQLGPWIALAPALAYLLDPHLQSAILTEFHAIPLAAPLVLWAFWAVETRRWRQFLTAALLLAAVKEEAALLAAGLGVWAWIRGRSSEPRPELVEGVGGQRESVGQATRFHISRFTSPAGRLALAVTAISLLWFYLATFVIVPHFAEAAHGSAESAYFQRYGALGDSPLDIFTSLFTRPGLVWQIASEPVRAGYVAGFLAAFGYLSLLAPEIILLALPLLLANLLSAYPAQYYGEFHYSAPLVPCFAVAALYGLGRLNKLAAALAPRAASLLLPIAAIWLLFSAGLHYAAAGRGPLGGRYDPTPITAHHRLLPRFLAQIPDEAAVTATAAVHPHVSHRRFVYQFPLGLDAAVPADWALIDVVTNTDMAPGDVKSTVDAMLARDWGVVDAADGFLLLRRGALEKTLPPAFYDFARSRGEAAALPLQFSGLEADDWPRWRQTRLISRWQVGQGYVPGSMRPWLEVRRPDGELLYTFADITPPALIWYPPGRWQSGELIQIETPALFLPRYWGAVAGVVHGPNASEAADRLPAALFTSDDRLPHSADGTLILAAAYEWNGDGLLQPLPNFIFPTPPADLDGVVLNPNGESLPFRTWLAPAAAYPGGDVQLAVDWGGPFPASRIAFVHLRLAGENIAQHDGPPALFIPLPASRTALPDWRELPIPHELAPGSELALVIGVYDPATGERLPVADRDLNPLGNEIRVQSFILADPPHPDQACALIPATCASQPQP